ncbi:MAG: sensor domain-containing diguanylate cyclase [Phycicoccus sp.]|nr:sensor domain-containing diguanylate cyclase [Phycicoccus sp.]NMM33378.1 sensor domain-containing diguanylate cyclase [Phycicoccus sp.]
MDKQFYQGLLDQISDGVYFVNTDRRITYWNGGAERITGYNADEVLGHSCSEGILRHVNDAGRQLCLQGCPLLKVMEDGKPREAHMYLHHKDGHRVPVTARGQALRSPDGTIVGSVEVFSSRLSNPYSGTVQRRKDDSLDPVTGLPPRRFGELHLETLMRAVAEKTTTLGVLYIDADHFKNVNDTFGHRTGDEVLRMVGQSLANGLRRGDMPVRWGGEEFLALLPGADQVGLHATAERVRMLAENSWIQKGEAQVRVTVSVGATMAVPDETAEDLVERADGFMYASKQGGRNRVTTDIGELTSSAEAPILGTSIPWEMPVHPT